MLYRQRSYESIRFLVTCVISSLQAHLSNSQSPHRRNTYISPVLEEQIDIAEISYFSIGVYISAGLCLGSETILSME